MTNPNQLPAESENLPQPSSPAASPKVDFTNAEGSGAAAILAFIHIGIAGVLGYGAWYIIANANPARLLSPLLMVQYLFPAFVAIMTYFPTDPLTKTLCTVARFAGWLGLFAYGVACAVAFSSATAPIDAEHVPFGILPKLIVIAANFSAAYLAAVLLSEAFRANLTGYSSTNAKSYFGGLVSFSTAVVVIGTPILHLTLDVPANKLTIAIVMTVLLGAPAARLAAYASVRRASSRPGLEPAIHTPIMLLSTAALLAFAIQPITGRPILAALLVGCGLWAALPYISRARIVPQK